MKMIMMALVIVMTTIIRIVKLMVMGLVQNHADDDHHHSHYRDHDEDNHNDEDTEDDNGDGNGAHEE